MTPLVEAMRALGLTGEVSSSGRWIRFSSERGSASVVEAAWGGGYYAFFDPPTKDVEEIYLDPLDAIEACLQRLGSKQPLKWRYQLRDAAPVPIS